jgi:NitT/TauT family transport system substrate-binding protein
VGLASEEDTTLFNAMVDSAGMEEGDIEHATVGTSGPLLAQLFEKGEIDAYVGNASDFTAMSANGVDLTNITPEDIGRIDGNPLAVLPDTLSEKEDAIVGFLRAWAKAQHLGQTHPELVEAIVRERVPAEWRNEASGEAALELAIDLMKPDDPQRIGDLRPDVWETGMDVLYRAKVIEEKGDVQGALNDELIEEINDWDRKEVEAAADKWLEENQ